MSPERSSLLRTAAAAGAAMALLTALLAPAGAQTDDELAAVRKRLDEANRQTARTMNEIKALDAQIFSVTRKVQKEEAEIASLESRIRDSEKQSVEVAARLQDVERARDKRARQIYKDGPATIVAALFAVRTFSDLPKFSVFWKGIAQQDARISGEASRLMERLEAEKATLSASSGALARRTQELKQMKETLESNRAQRTASLGKMRRSIVEAMAAEKSLLAARARAAAEAAKAKAAAEKTAAAQVRPSPGPCVPGKAAKDQRLAALLNWYAPAAGLEPFMPPKLGPTDVVFTGVTSWYGPGFEGCATSSGATFRSGQMTAASLSLPLGTLLKVTSGGKSVVVVITDRGPYIEGRDLDLSKGAATAIGVSGVASVRMEVVMPNEPAPPFP